MPDEGITPDWLVDRVQRNIRLLKSIRDLTDERIAERGGFTSRQVFSNRLSGRNMMGVDDVARIAGALEVEPFVLLLRSDEVLAWVEDHIGFVAPDYLPNDVNPNKARH